MSHPPPCRCANNPHLSINQSISLSIYLSLIYLSIWPASPCHLLLSSTALLWRHLDGLNDSHAEWNANPEPCTHCRADWPLGSVPTRLDTSSLCADGSGWAAIHTHTCVFATETLKWSMLYFPVYYCMSQWASKQAQSLWLCLLISSPQKQIICMCLMNFTKHWAAPQTCEPDGLCMCECQLILVWMQQQMDFQGDVCAVNVQLTKVSCLNICGIFCAINTKKAAK